MTVRVATVTGTVLASTEFRGFLYVCYYATLPNLKKKCDSCIQSFSVRHGLRCIHGGLVIELHNKVHENLL